MHRFYALLSTLTGPLALSVSPSADVVACGPGIPPQVICLVGNVSDLVGGGPLVSGRVYHLSGPVFVPDGETLTIQDGTILKFETFAYLYVNGTLVAGDATLTSIKDDGAGGDTNGDNPELLPMPGDWDGLGFGMNSDASVCTSTTIRYGTGVSLNNASIELDGVSISDCSSTALYNQWSYPAVTNCSFSRCRFAVETSLASLPGFIGNSAIDNTDGDCIEIEDGVVDGSFAVGLQNSLDGRAFAVCANISVSVGTTLTLQPGVIFKFGEIPDALPHCGRGDLDIAGTLIANGVIFTSLEDDSIGGDLPKDGPTFGAPGDWGTLLFRSTSEACVLANTLIRFGGDATFGPAPAIRLSQADVALDSVSVVECASHGLSLNNDSYPTVRNCSFSDNAGIAIDCVHPAAVSGFTNNSAQNNAGDYMRLLGAIAAPLAGGVAIEKDSSLNQDGVFVVASDIAVPAGVVLTLGEGVILKWTVPENHEINVSGTLTIDGALGAEVVLTPLTDDEIGGDTNKDGGATQPVPGDWNGIRFFPGSDASTVDRARVRFAGNSSLVTAAVHLSAASPTLTFTTIERSESACLSLVSAAFPQVADCVFRDSDRAVIGLSIRALQGFTGNSASGNAKGDSLSISNGDVSFGSGGLVRGGSLVIGPSNGLADVLVFTDDIFVPVGYHLGILPGTIVKFDGPRELDVGGIAAVGGIGNAVVLTSIDDDSVGGDTANDGATDGAPGDWRQVRVSANGSSFDTVVVRFAGSSGADAVRLVGSNATLTDVTIEDSAATALAIPSSMPLVDGCELKRNQRAVDQASIRALLGFSDNSAEDNTLGDYIRVTDGNVTSDLLVRTQQSLDGRPFVFATNVNVLAGATLTLDAGVVFKFDGNRAFDVQGTLTTNAAPGSIVLTTLTDDIAGDTNKDLGASVPAPGAWAGLAFGSNSDASTLIGARVRYAGSLGGPALHMSASDALISDTLVERSGGKGLQLSSARPRVQRTAFVDGLGLPVDFASIGALPGFLDNTASGNVPGDYIRVSDSTFTGSVVVGRNNSLNSNGVFVVDTGLSVGMGQRLELRQGTIIKWQGNRSLNVNTNGTLIVEGTGFEPVVFTSIHDDAIGGDTQKNGASTVPAPGNWGGIVVNNSPGASALLEHLRARHGGSGGGSVQLSQPAAVARSIRAEHSSTDGIRVSSLSGSATNWVAFQNGGDGIDVSGGTFDLLHATAASNAGVGVRAAAAHLGALRNSNSFANAGGALAGFAPGEVLSSNAGAAFSGTFGNIDADPLFTDLAGGDLSLASNSPCLDAADLDAALALPEDHREASRILDHDLDGSALPDMGAFERAAWELVVGGAPQVASVMGFTVQGATPGVAIFYLGPLGGEAFLPPLGFRLHGPTTTSLALGARSVGSTLYLPIPHASTLVGMPFGVQARVHPSLPAAARGAPGRGSSGVATGSTAGGPSQATPLAPGKGNFTSLYRARVLP